MRILPILLGLLLTINAGCKRPADTKKTAPTEPPPKAIPPVDPRKVVPS